MAESSQSAVTPASSTGKSPAVKDRDCPFCGQNFTSSSLGRHLDLYIKPKNPKPADGKHDVEEIKRMRRNITRRQPRSSNRRNISTPLSSRDTPSQPPRSPLPPGYQSEAQANVGDTYQTYVNRPNWQATGVINDLPQTDRDMPHLYLTRRAGHAKEDDLRKKEYQRLSDRAQAAELALKDVCESLKAAKRRAHPSAPFDLNLFSLNLPQMYLQCLAPPPSLLAEPSKRPHDLTWTVMPPSNEQCESLRAWLSSKINDWRQRRRNADFGNPYPPNAVNGHTQVTSETDPLAQEEASYHEHLENAFAEWARLSDTERRDEWQLECARAFAREQEKHQATVERLEQHESEIQQLKARVDSLAAQHGVPEALVLPTMTTSMSRDTVNNLPASLDLDYDRVLSGWTARVQSANSHQRDLPAINVPSSALGPNTNGQYPSPLTEQRDSWGSRNGMVDGNEEIDSELADAPGEVDTDAMEDAHPHSLRATGSLGSQKRRQNDGNRTANDMGGHGSMDLG